MLRKSGKSGTNSHIGVRCFILSTQAPLYPAVDLASVKSLQFAARQTVVFDYTAREEQRLSLVTLDISPGGAAILFANPGIDLYSAPTLIGTKINKLTNHSSEETKC